MTAYFVIGVLGIRAGDVQFAKICRVQTQLRQRNMSSDIVQYNRPNLYNKNDFVFHGPSSTSISYIIDYDF